MRLPPPPVTPPVNFLPTTVNALNSPEEVRDVTSEAGVAVAEDEKGEVLATCKVESVAKVESQSSK